MLLLTLTKIIFWFHPLPYLFRQRLLMLHEYQADRIVDSPLSDYGTFLVEQSLLSPAPSVSHSFNRSPLKKRIVMLTRKSSSWSKSRMLLAIPVLTVSLLCFSKNAFSDFKRVQKGNIVTFRGNEFELIKSAFRTIHSQNPETGVQEEFTFEITPYPIKMNNSPLLNTDSVDKKPVAEKNLNAYIGELFQKNKALFGQLEDGIYSISIFHFVCDENGDVRYYKYDGVESNNFVESPGTKELERQNVNPVHVKEKIDWIIEEMAVDIRFIPAIKNGRATACLFSDYGSGSPFSFTVQNHVVYEGEKPLQKTK